MLSLMPDVSSVVHVLTRDAVRWGIDTLGAQRVHPTFLMYLYLRTESRAGTLAGASASSDDLLRLIKMPGNPMKPYYFPLIDRGKRTGTPLPSFWRSPNIPGSWSPGSIRRLQGGSWLSADTSSYTMPDDHVQLARREMLYNEPVSALAMGAYSLRNDGFITSGAPTKSDLIAAFRRQFDFPKSADDEYNQLFHDDLYEDSIVDPWFAQGPELDRPTDEVLWTEDHSVGLFHDVRQLTGDDLEIGVRAKAMDDHTSSAPDAPDVAPDDPKVQEIIRLAAQFGGVILTGPPGTSKSFYAAAAAQTLAEGVDARMQFVQFHASYQYEDFMAGFRPTPDGFEPQDGAFLSLVHAASADPDHTYVIVIDELSRADVGRVFGEALTYVERSKRELPFTIANGDRVKVPTNLVVIATMNPFDRGVDEVDAAFERRFAKISMDADRSILQQMLDSNGMEESLSSKVLGWFSQINGHAKRNPAAAVGHAYFASASDEASLVDLWDYQLQYLVQRAFRRDEDTRAAIEVAWSHVTGGASEDGSTP